MRVVGEEGTLVADLLVPSLSRAGTELVDLPLAASEPLATQFESFCSLLEGVPDGSAVSLDEGLRAVASAEAAEPSAREGRPITL